MNIFNAVIAREEGQKLQAYVTGTENENAPGIVLMHEVYGVTEGLKEVADYFAAQGFLVACPNMYWRENDTASFLYEPSADILDAMSRKERRALEKKLVKDRDDARNLMFNIVGNTDPAKGEIIDDPDTLAARQSEIIDTIERVAAFLRDQDQCNGLVASAGFCFGARNTYIALAEHAAVEAGIAFYPTPKLHEVFDAAKAGQIDKPLMFVYGGQDGYISGQEKKAMRDASGTVIRYVPGDDRPLISVDDYGNHHLMTLAYTANDHGFNRRKSKYSDPGASNHVLTSAVEFLKAALDKDDPKFRIPQHAVKEMPQSPLYLPEYKV